jgi:Fic family protein
MANTGRSLAEQAIGIVGLVYRAPRTARDAASIADCKEETARRYLNLLAQEGVVKKIAGRRGRALNGGAIYEWIHDRSAT